MRSTRKSDRKRNSRRPSPAVPKAPAAPAFYARLRAGGSRSSTNPVFADPISTPDPLKYKVPHASDAQAYAELDQLIASSRFLPVPFPPPRATSAEPILTLAQALGASGAAAEKAIQSAGRIVFHAVGDTGATRGPSAENLVADKMLADFEESDPTVVPHFFYHLGDIVYSFGEHKYYFDQFYDAYRAYPRPIFAIPGNHDGIVLPPPNGTSFPSLSAYLANFCSPDFQHATDALGLARTTMIQPGVFFTLQAPFVRILGLYSNILESPGVISDQSGRFPEVGRAQLDYLLAALTRVKNENYTGALVIAVHHPPYSFGRHTGSMAMLKEIDAVCQSVGVWPHAFLSGHVHNYQRYTRTLNGMQIPFVDAGMGGHGLTRLSVPTTIRTPAPMPIFEQPERRDTVTLESYDSSHYGYLRILADAAQLRIEYHPATDGVATKTPDDAVTVDLQARSLIHFNLRR